MPYGCSVAILVLGLLLTVAWIGTGLYWIGSILYSLFF